jgi:hypothetical protein
MDTRLLVIAGPLLVAASWALFNIGRLAIQQIQRLMTWLKFLKFKKDKYQSFDFFNNLIINNKIIKNYVSYC